MTPRQVSFLFFSLSQTNYLAFFFLCYCSVVLMFPFFPIIPYLSFNIVYRALALRARVNLQALRTLRPETASPQTFGRRVIIKDPLFGWPCSQKHLHFFRPSRLDSSFPFRKTCHSDIRISRSLRTQGGPFASPSPGLRDTPEAGLAALRALTRHYLPLRLLEV